MLRELSCWHFENSQFSLQSVIFPQSGRRHRRRLNRNEYFSLRDFTSSVPAANRILVGWLLVFDRKVIITRNMAIKRISFPFNKIPHVQFILSSSCAINFINIILIRAFSIMLPDSSSRVPISQ